MSEKTIPFARRVKNEIAINEYTTEQKKYLLSGFARNGGTFSFGRKSSLELRTEIAAVAKLLYSCLKECYGLNPSIQYEKVSRFGRGLAYLVRVEDEKVEAMMEDLEILQDGFIRIPPKEGLHRRNLQYLIIGSFLANGSVNNPASTKTSYFAEMAFSDKADAMAIKHKVDTFKEEKTMSFKYIVRREKHVLYLKKSDQISVFLHYLGSLEAMFEFENARIMKDDINNDNRIAICDSANLAKTLQSLEKDMSAIDLVLSVTPMSLFDQKTQAVILARREKTEMNYRELAEYLQKNKGVNITKSGVVHILRNLREKAEKIQEENDAKAE